MQGSPALQLVISQGWGYKVVNTNQIVLDKCPFCGKENHFYMEVHGPNSEQKNRSGLYMCQRCAKSGNLYSLRQHLGLAIEGVSSQKDWAESEKKIDKLCDTEACHLALLEDEAAIDYLMNVRGFSLDIIKKQKIGLTKHYFKSTGEVRALVFPYLLNGNTIWEHYRTLPDPNDLKKVPKDFASPRGWDSTLYNIEALQTATTDIILVEGEANCIAALDHGITNICGVPGANIKKMEWLDKMENIGKVFIAYDKDKVGQKAAQVLASRIGIERCYKITLPDFEVVTEAGESRKGKDLNEWFRVGGGTPEAFEELKKGATLFDVDGVSSAADALDEFAEELEGKGAGQKYVWPLISEIVQFDDGDCIDILAEEKIGKTTFGMNLIEYMVDTYGDDGIIICAEMTKAKLARKWVSHKAQIADNLPKTPEEGIQLTQLFKLAIPDVKKMAANRQGTLYLCCPKFTTMDDIYKLIIDCIRRYGVKWIMLDNIQRFCDLTIGNKNRTQWLSEISKRTSQIGKDYSVQMVRILQPNRVAENKLTAIQNTDGASHIAKDCDCTLILNRNRVGGINKETFAAGGYVESHVTYSPEMLVTCAISRYSAGGETQVWYDGATSTIAKLNEGKIKSMMAITAGGGVMKQASTAIGTTMPLDALKAAVGQSDEQDGDIPV